MRPRVAGDQRTGCKQDNRQSGDATDTEGLTHRSLTWLNIPCWSKAQTNGSDEGAAATLRYKQKGPPRAVSSPTDEGAPAEDRT
jgi:hypothetical protein